MIVKRTHHALHWAFGLFVAYLLITRLFISWVQFLPNQFVATSQWLTGSTIQFGSINIDQDWLGFQADVKKLSVKSSDFEFQAEELKIDINLFSLLIPSAGYGDYLEISKGAFQPKAVVNAQVDDQPLNLQDIGKIDANISHLWKRIKLKDFVITEFTRPGLSVQLHEFQSLNGVRLSVASEFSLSYKDILNYERFNFKSSFTPNIWGGIENGEFSLSSFRPLSIKRLSKLLSVNWQSVLPDGELILDLKGKVAQSQLSSMTLNLNTQALKWHQKHKGLPESLGLKLLWNMEHQNIPKQLKDWQFTLSNIQIDNRFIDSVSAMQLKFEGQDFLRFNADYFDIDPFKVIVKSLIHNPHIAKIFDRSAYLNISNLNGRFNWKTLALPDLEIVFDRLDLPVSEYPGMSLRNLKIVKTEESVTVSSPNPVWLMEPRVHNKPMRIDLPDSFTLDFNQKSQAWSLPQATVLVNKIPVLLTLKKINAQKIDSNFEIKISSMSQLKEYLPYGFMSPKLKSWLTKGLLAGEDIELKGVLRGAFDHFPYKNGGGVFEMTGQVKNASLLFNSDWPVLKNFDANLTFTPFKLDIAVDKLPVGANVTADNVLVEINDLDQKDIALTVKGKVNAKLPNIVNYLQLSPLAKTIGLKEFLQEGAKLNGDASVNLEKIWIPISGYKKRSETVLGNVVFKNADLKILNKIQLENLQGQLNFSEKGVSAKRLNFNLFQGRGHVAVSTNSKTQKVRISGNGHFLENNHTWFKNAIPWKTAITVPFKKAKQKDININLTMSLDKAESKLPEPLNQSSLNTKKATIDTTIIDGSIHSVFNLPGLVNANLNWAKFKDGYALSNTKVWIGKSQIDKKQSMNNLSYVKGEIERLALDEWIPIAKELNLSSTENNQHPLQWAKSEVFVKDIKFLSHDYNNLILSWKSQQKTPLKIDLHNNDIDGTVTLTSKNLINVDVNKFRFYTDEINKSSKTGSAKDEVTKKCSISDTASLLPTIEFKGKELILNDRKIDAINFKLTDTPEKMLIQKINGTFGAGAGVINGQYQLNKKTDQSEIQAQLTSKNVTAVTDFIKLNKGFTGKSGKVNLKLHWNGGLHCFSTEQSAGNIKFVLEDGSVEDIEPGFARLIGLLSVESLIRRLQLDIKDVTNKGMVYDQIKGEAELNHNVLTIKNFTIKAPSANGIIKGQTNIKTQIFDLNAQITPKIGATLPTIAAFAGAANPLAALAVYTLMKVLPGVNENLVTYKYKITGPWSSPIIDGNHKEEVPLQNRKDTILDY
ncbi:YhdP family protein [Thiomicrorhabdus sp.]|uniref:YhdP family phospholipid transporter n=1 Tax=Thiomicrorhabdus sp. TaxID=2039724 RepID=UPI002AA72B68|nr:AsmA-like C-terminal region-containing protein [Thiomicrorhabdus sp.]